MLLQLNDNATGTMLNFSVLDFCGGIKIRNESLIGLIYFPRPFNDTYSANKNDKLSKNKK